MKIFIVSLFMFSTAVYGDIKWSNGEKICVKGKGKSPGYWTMPASGKLKAVKLTHDGDVSTSFVTCIKHKLAKTKTFWGCGDYVNVHVTDMENVSPFPTPGVDSHGFYKQAGRNALSPNLVFGDIFGPDFLTVKAGDEVKIWYGQDLFISLKDQDKQLKGDMGTTCMMAHAYITA